jgi:hypothetical protein
MTVTTAGVPGTTTPHDGSSEGTSRRWRVIAGILAFALVLALAGAVVQAMRASSQSDAQAALLADQTVTKTFQELERQAALPAAQRSIDALEWAIATPQSDTTGTVWTTTVLSSNLAGDTLTARVSTTLAASPLQAPSHYLEFVAQVTAGSTSGENPTVSTCAVRSGSSDSAPATANVNVTPHMVMQPCSADLLRQLGVAT